jgi:hypothetical protein
MVGDVAGDNLDTEPLGIADYFFRISPWHIARGSSKTSAIQRPSSS